MKQSSKIRLLMVMIITIILPKCTVCPHTSQDDTNLEFRDMIQRFDHLFMQRRAGTPSRIVNSVTSTQQPPPPHHQQQSFGNFFNPNVDATIHVHHQKQRFHRDNSRSVKLSNEQYGGFNDPQQQQQQQQLQQPPQPPPPPPLPSQQDLLPMSKLSTMQMNVDDDLVVPPQPPQPPILSGSSASSAQTPSSAASSPLTEDSTNNNNANNIPSRQQSSYQTEKNPVTNGMVVQPIVVASNNQMDSNNMIQDNVPEILITIDNRLQKLQDTIHYYRTMNNYGINSPNCPSYFSLIKTQFLSLENIFESKLSNIEHKFSNIEIEDGIWKKTINWKVEEMSSKITQTENKISFTNEQFMNKLDLIERSFKVITNDFFAKFLLINEKLNKIEMNMQNNLNEFETKLWKTFDYQKKLTNVFPVDQPPMPSSSSSSSINGVSSSETLYMANRADNYDDETLQSQQPQTQPQQQQQQQLLDIDPQSSNIRVQNHQQQWYGTRNSKWLPTIQTINPRMVNQSSNKIDSSLLAENISSIQILEELANERQDLLVQSLNINNNNNNKTIVSNNSNPNSTQQQTSSTTAATAATSTATVTEQQQTSSTFRNINPIRNGGNNGNNDNNKNWIVSTSTATVAPPMVASTISVYQKHEELFAQCEQVFKRWKQNKFHPLPPEDYNLIFNVCKELLSIDGNVWTTNGAKEAGGGGLDNNNNEKTIDNFVSGTIGGNPNYLPHHHQQHQHAKERIEKRDSKLEEEIMIDNNKQHQPPLPSPSTSLPLSSSVAAASASQQHQQPKPPVKDTEKTANLDDIINQSSNVDYIPSNKLEELDSKLQFFSTKIIRIVQEMWHSTQTSQQYLLETFNVVNRTEDLIKEELKKINNNLKPINQILTIDDEIREPILTRLKEMSTAINNSVEVILNTQAQYIMRQDEQDNKIMEIILNELHNKSSLIHKKVHEQGNILNRKFDQIYSNINQIGKKTMEMYNSESLRLLDLFKSEIHTLKTVAEQNRNMANQNGHSEMDMDSPKSMPQNNHHHPCENECFISRKEFENVCFNIETTKPYDFRSESMPITSGQEMGDFLDTNKNISDIEINNGHNDNGQDIHHIHEDRSRRKFKRAVYEIFINNKLETKSRKTVPKP